VGLSKNMTAAERPQKKHRPTYPKARSRAESGSSSAPRAGHVREGMLRVSSVSLPGEGSWRIGLLLLAVCTFFGFGFGYHNFLSVSNIEVILLNVSSTVIAGVGTMMLLISGNVDLSIGSLWAFDAMVVALVAHDTQSLLVPLVVGIVLGAVTGLVNGSLVVLLRINPLIVTLAMSLIWGGAAYIISGGYSIYGFSHDFDMVGNGRVATVPIPVIVAIAIFLLGSAYLIGTVGGLRLYAIGGNRDVARLAGARVQRTTVGMFAFNGMLLGVVAILNVGQQANATPQVGTNFALEVLTAVILGGVAFTGGGGNPFGVLVGIVAVGIVVAGLIFIGIASWYQSMAQGAILLVALASDQYLVSWRAGKKRSVDSGSRRERARKCASISHEEAPKNASRIMQLQPSRSQKSSFEGTEPILDCRHLTRRYGAIAAVSDVSFSVRRGEVLALVGDNGAGKSTIVKMLAGDIRPDSGEILLAGTPLPVGDPAAIRDMGVQTVFQHLALCQNLSVRHNIVLGAEPVRRIGRLARVRADDIASLIALEQLARFGLDQIGPLTIVRLLSGGQQQAVAIARALIGASEVLILDEPTAALGVRQTAVVLDVIRAVAAAGVAIVLVSHDIEAIMQTADSLVVMRHGQVAHSGRNSEISQGELVHLMAGLTDLRVH